MSENYYDDKRKEIRADNILIPYQLIERELESEQEDEAFCLLCHRPLVRERKNNYNFTNHTFEECLILLQTEG